MNIDKPEELSEDELIEGASENQDEDQITEAEQSSVSESEHGSQSITDVDNTENENQDENPPPEDQQEPTDPNAPQSDEVTDAEDINNEDVDETLNEEEEPVKLTFDIDNKKIMPKTKNPKQSITIDKPLLNSKKLKTELMETFNISDYVKLK